MFTLNRALNTLNRFPFGVRFEHVLPKLPYPSNALEPVICAEIMELHHEKHHNTYIQNLNAAESELQDAMAKSDLPKMISLQPALKFNGGGHINHSILWKNLSPCGGQPSEELMRVLCGSFGSFDAMKDEMRAAANGIQGSGWAWLGYNKKTGRLEVAICPKQNPLQPTTGLVPLLGIDVWEHAYYLQYKNARAEYTKRIFDIINWNDVSDRFARGKC